MSVYVVCFSPTGGTEKVMNLLTKHVKVDGRINLLQKEIATLIMKKEDICYIGIPSFGGRVPACVLTHMKKIRGDHTRLILLVTYGNRAYDDTLLELKEIMQERGFTVMAAVTAISEHSIMRQYGHGRPDENDQMELIQFGDQIKDKIQQGGVYEINVPGKKPYRVYNGVPFKPKANKCCTKCGICAKACPVGVISLDHMMEVNHDVCISCMRCIAVCPQGARVLNQVLLKAATLKMKQAFAVPKKNELFI